jgi:D-lactate dehydrogenase
LIGSEGTLAITTEATLKLIPIPQSRVMMRALYQDIQSAADAVSTIMGQPETPAALEFMDSVCLQLIRHQLSAELPDGTGAMLLIEADGSPKSVNETSSAIQKAAENSGLINFHIAQTDHEAQQLWQARKILSPRLREIAPKKINEDVVVPVSRIPELVSTIQQLAEHHQIRIANFGHAGNGNLHTNILVDPDNLDEMARAELCLKSLFEAVLSLKGSISGEHGVGIVKQPYVAQEIGLTERQLMSDIKQLFDPHSILNPGKGPQI